MNGGILVTTGYNGWGNRKSGCEAYGPGGRWAGPRELPNRANENVVYGDLLGDHLDEHGAHEGSPFIVIAFTSRYSEADRDRLRVSVEDLVESFVSGAGEGKGSPVPPCDTGPATHGTGPARGQT